MARSSVSIGEESGEASVIETSGEMRIGRVAGVVDVAVERLG